MDIETERPTPETDLDHFLALGFEVLAVTLIRNVWASVAYGMPEHPKVADGENPVKRRIEQRANEIMQKECGDVAVHDMSPVELKELSEVVKRRTWDAALDLKTWFAQGEPEPSTAESSERFTDGIQAELDAMLREPLAANPTRYLQRVLIYLTPEPSRSLDGLV